MIDFHHWQHSKVKIKFEDCDQNPVVKSQLIAAVGTLSSNSLTSQTACLYKAKIITHSSRCEGWAYSFYYQAEFHPTYPQYGSSNIISTISEKRSKLVKQTKNFIHVTI